MDSPNRIRLLSLIDHESSMIGILGGQIADTVPKLVESEQWPSKKGNIQSANQMLNALSERMRDIGAYLNQLREEDQ